MRRLTTEEFIERAKGVHEDRYNYSKANYINIKTKVCIICSIHGEFWQIPDDHIRGSGCEKCSYIIRGKNKTQSVSTFIEKAKKAHRNKYDYSKVKYVNCKIKICIICPKHGEFWQRPDCHSSGYKNGCPSCKESRGEKKLDYF